MRVELTRADVKTSLHGAHEELWVRVLSDEPLGPDAWYAIVSNVDPGLGLRTWSKPCAFYADIWEDDDPEHQLYGFEQWWIFPTYGDGAHEQDQDRWV